VKKVVHSSADLTQRETVVAECLEQFQIIQIGLNQIIDSGLTDNTKSLKSQTEFLRSKIVGSRSLVLSPDEGQMVPVSELHQLRAAYEAKIQEMEEEHKAEIRNLYARYEPSKLSTCARIR
jgi:hypothetical protein